MPHPTPPHPTPPHPLPCAALTAAPRWCWHTTAGICDALEKQYLRKVYFGFSRDREGKDLLEEVRGARG